MPAARAAPPALAALAALAALSALSALAALAAVAAEVLPSYTQPAFTTLLQKGYSWAELNEEVGPLYIPANQCSGVLDDLMRCQNNRKLRAVRVQVQDGTIARVSLDNDLSRAAVLRASCTEEAVVHLRLACSDMGGN